MSIEFASGNITLLDDVQKRFKTEAGFYADKSKNFYEQHPDAVKVEQCDGAVNKKMAEVYLETAKQVESVLQQHKRNLVRTINPFYSKLSDEEADKIVEEWGRDGYWDNL